MKTIALASGCIVALLVLLFVLEEKIFMLHVGDRAPDFSALTQAGERIRLSDFHGRKNIVLYFYPKDYTAGCTEQACTLRDNYAELQKLDAVVLGVSADDRYSHSMFAASYNLPFTLLSDPDRTIMREYGSRWLGGLLPVTKRVTYVIDKGGIIGAVIHHEVNMSKHVEDALASLQRLQSR